MEDRFARGCDQILPMVGDRTRGYRGCQVTLIEPHVCCKSEGGDGSAAAPKHRLPDIPRNDGDARKGVRCLSYYTHRGSFGGRPMVTGMESSWRLFVVMSKRSIRTL